MLEQNPSKIAWSRLSLNAYAIHILEKNVDRIYWKELSHNPNAISILEKNVDKINWQTLSINHNAIHLLESRLDTVVIEDEVEWNTCVNVDWEYLSENRGIFEERFLLK